MRVATLETIFRTLNAYGVRYLVVGGVAVNVYGYVRGTQDLDLVIDLREANIRRATSALQELGYRPMVPVRIEEFADAEQRRRWIEERNMEVFSLVSERYRDTVVGVFVREPFDFDLEYETSQEHRLSQDVVFRVARVESLIAMKQTAGRDRDRDDVSHLRMIQAERAGGEE